MNDESSTDRCEATTRSGGRCRNRKLSGSMFCVRHQKPRSTATITGESAGSVDSKGAPWKDPAYERDRNLGSSELAAEVARWPRGRELARSDIAHILEDHKLWRSSKGKDGQRGDLSYANFVMQTMDRFWFPYGNLRGARFMISSLRQAMLSNADLRGASLNDTDLREASLWSTDLRGAYLRNAKLAGAHLDGADLTGAVMDGATLDGEEKSAEEIEEELDDLRDLFDERAKPFEIEKRRPPAALDGAKLRDAILSDARLAEVTGLRPEALAGADLSGARLPADIAKFEPLATIAEVSKAASAAHLTMIGACFYSMVTVATTELGALSSTSAVTKLPILATDIPVATFFVAAPVILFGVYVYLHMYLIRLWELLGTLPARFPDGRALDEKAHPWLLISLVRLYVPLLRRQRMPLWWLQVAMSIASGWLLVPATILLFLMPFLRVENWLHAAIVGMLLLGALAVGLATMELARRYLTGQSYVTPLKMDLES